jgi:hypothetical protein
MNDVSTIKSPGWQRVVGDLSALVPDDRVFLLRLMSTLGMVTGARQATLFLVAPGSGEQQTVEVKAAQVWPFAQGMVDAQGRLTQPGDVLTDPSRFDVNLIDRGREVTTAARTVAASKSVQVFSLDQPTTSGQFYGGGDASNQSGMYVIAAAVAQGLPHETGQLPARAVVTVQVESRNKQALASMVALVEVLCGYVFAHEAQQALRRTRQSSAALDLAARLIASMNATTGFRACSMQFVNDLCRQLSVDRVALGWVPGTPAKWPGRRVGEARLSQAATNVHLKALSDTEHLDRRMEMCRKIEHAMEECLDQEQPVLFPAPSAVNDAVLANAITHAHRDLARNDANLRVASFPLRVVDSRGEKIAGVVLIESAGQGKLDPAAAELVQATLDLVAPVLAVRASDDRNLGLRTYDSAVRAAAWAVGPKHTVWKVAGITLMIATAVLLLGRTTYRIGAPMELRAETQRVISAPVNAPLLSVAEGIDEGAKVSAGQTLAMLDTQEIRVNLQQAVAEFSLAEKQADDALRKGDAGAAAQSRAKADQAKAKMDMLQLQIERSTLASPIDGTVIRGDLRDKLGATLKMGDEMFIVADLSTVTVRAKVDDRDISFIRVGQTGEVSPKSNPSLKIPIKVRQIVPLAQAAEGTNTFEVRCELIGEPQPWFLPGLEGQVKLNTESRSFAWIASRRIVDQLRVWLWW